jgi:hypothetical protein
MASARKSSSRVRMQLTIFIDGVPGPGSVEVKGEFQKGSARPKAFSFGLAREYFKKVYFKEGATVDPVVPGPGRYSLTTCIGNDAKPVTIKGRNMKERSQSKKYIYSYNISRAERFYTWAREVPTET